MSSGNWRVTAFGVAGGEFTYEVKAETKSEALEEAYGEHGRRLREGAVGEALGTQAGAVRIDGGEPRSTE
ncbi:hypothetical protein ACFW2V_13845 [Streptomyces sp. NPDC058947]|uniref:hypothetical protein n=1 Tax=Streptomyces sp. NPDC058947 TaxID=3346675 RepID=UPI0036CED53F